MGWRFRKSFNAIPGVRVTLSSSGISTSVGVGPLRTGVGSRGAALAGSIPGTGLSFRQPLVGAGSVPAPAPGLPLSVPATTPWQVAVPAAPVMQDIKSAESTVLTSEGLSAFKQSLDQAERQFAEIDHDLRRAKIQESAAVDVHTRWSNGWLFKRIRKQRFAEITNQAEEATAFPPRQNTCRCAGRPARSRRCKSAAMKE